MKAACLFAFLYCFSPIVSIAQSPDSIEADLNQSYKKIDQWAVYRNQHRVDATLGNYMRANDSLGKATTIFGEKLQYYTAKYPSTIVQKFSSIAQKKDVLPKDKVEILTSTDGLFRIYSWDTRSDGTMYGFDHVFQYKTGANTKSILALDTGRDYVYFYSNLYTIKVKNKTYYLAVYDGIYSSAGIGNGIQVFAIENGKLNSDVKLIKTTTGLHSQLYYEYNFSYVVDWKVRPTIYFDGTLQEIRMPLIVEKGKVTHKFITYKFNGQYFEKVKS